MEKYRLIQEHSHDGAEYESTTHDNRRRTMVQPDSSGFPEVRITQQGKPRNYISYAMSLLVRNTEKCVCLYDCIW